MVRRSVKTRTQRKCIRTTGTSRRCRRKAPSWVPCSRGPACHTDTHTHRHTHVYTQPYTCAHKHRHTYMPPGSWVVILSSILITNTFPPSELLPGILCRGSWQKRHLHQNSRRSCATLLPHGCVVVRGRDQLVRPFLSETHQVSLSKSLRTHSQYPFPSAWSFPVHDVGVPVGHGFTGRLRHTGPYQTTHVTWKRMQCRWTHSAVS